MADENLGASFSIDITELKAGLAQANRLIRESESQFREAAAGMDDWTDSQEGLEARVKSLNTQVGIQQQKVSALSAEKKRIISTMQAEGKSNDEIARAVDGVNKQIERESKQLSKLKGELKKGEQALDEFENGTDEAGKGLEGLGKAGGIAVKAIGAVAAAAGAAIGAFFGLAESTREYRRDMAQLAQNAGDAGVSLDSMKDKMIEVGAVTGEADAALEGMNMLMATGLDTSQIETAADALTGAATKFDGLKFEGMAEGLQETLATGVAVGPFAELIERTGTDLEGFNEGLANCTTEAEKQAYAMQFLTESGLIEANAQYKETNKSLIENAEAEARMTDQLAQLGAIAEPIMTQLKLLTTDLLASITPFVAMIGEGLTGAMNGTAGASETLAAGIGGVIDTLLTSVTSMLPSIIETVATLIPSIVSSLVEKLPMIFQVILDAIPMILNLLSSTLPQILTKIMSMIPVLAKQLIAAAPKILQAAITLLMSIVKALPTIITNLIAALPSLIESLISTLMSMRGQLLAGAVTLLMEIVKAIPQIASSLVSSMPAIITAIVNGLRSGFSKVSEVGRNLIEGLWNGISDMVGWIGGKIKGFGESVLGGLKSFFGIASPSRVMADVVGKNLALGIGEGFGDAIGGVSDDINRAAGKISPTIDAQVNAASGGLASGKNGGVVVNQNNYYSKAHSRYEIYKSKQQTAAAVRLAVGGA